MPALRYRDTGAAIAWLCGAFGFAKHAVASSEDGGIAYAHLTLGEAMVMVRPVRDSNLDRLMKQPDEIGGAETQSCYFVVGDADLHYRTAKAAGAGIVLDIGDDGHGGRGYSCRDPEGHIWSFGTYDPWQRRRPPAARRLRRVVAVAALLAGISAAAAAGLMLPWAAGRDAARLQLDAASARERAEAETARADRMAAELAQARGDRDSALLAGQQTGQALALQQDATAAAQRDARQLEEQLAEARMAKDGAERAAEHARIATVTERTARDAAQQIAFDRESELARERDARQRAERLVQDLIEQLAGEQRAREAAERAAKEATEQLASRLAEGPKAMQSVNAVPAKQQKAREHVWDCRPRPPNGQVVCHPVKR